MNNSDLLEKLDIIKEAVERNPDEWWREIQWCDEDGKCYDCAYDASVFNAIMETGTSIRLKPQRVKVEGWVEPEVIETAMRLAEAVPYSGEEKTMVAQALLQLVKEKGDG